MAGPRGRARCRAEHAAPALHRRPRACRPAGADRGAARRRPARSPSWCSASHGAGSSTSRPSSTRRCSPHSAYRRACDAIVEGSIGDALPAGFTPGSR